MNLLLDKRYAKYVLIHILLFGASVLVGVFLGYATGNIGEIPFLMKPFYDYFFHNILACMTLITLGVLTYGWLTWILVIYNGVTLGLAVKFLTYSYSMLQILGLFSHAIFELPALFISIYLGKVISVELLTEIQHLFRHKTLRGKGTSNWKTICIQFLVMILFLFLASFIEAIPK